MPRNLIFYIAVLLLFGAGIAGILQVGAELRPAPAARLDAPATPPAAAPDGLAATLRDNLHHPFAILLLQVLVIVAAARLLGAICRRIGQPPVIGEMIAGILLGPSLLGTLAPGLQAALFPADSLGPLRLLSQVGVVLFMFVVGIELDVQHLRRRADAAVLVSHASIVVPFFLGVAGALFLYRALAPAGVAFGPFALFMGVAMSITAFPVLARIIEERGLSGTHLGSVAIACAAVDDVTAWCLLAVVVAIVRAGGAAGALPTVALTLLFIAAMLFLVRPWLARRAALRPPPDNGRGAGLLAGVLVFVVAAALSTELIGIHALFGAFLAGVAMPEDAALRQFLRERMETFSSVFLLPLFFAFTGLRTQIGLLDDLRGWLLCAAIIALAIAGKLGASMAAARWTGMGWGDAFALGALMNTRGLVELIVLNLGYDLGILSPRIFAMLVLMALVTTFMTGPLLNLLAWWRRREAPAAEAPRHLAT
ncbi:MAG TPA: cation:proton antiporter [Thermoanaerobaculia bacterium]|nr:cation:proton antiporter [Thermoanaerobaculia bacterium]